MAGKWASPSLLLLCSSLSAQSRSIFHYVRLTASMLYRMRLSFNHFMYFMIPKKKNSHFNKENLSCFLRVFHTFITGISHTLQTNKQFTSKTDFNILTFSLVPINHEHWDSTACLLITMFKTYSIISDSHHKHSTPDVFHFIVQHMLQCSFIRTIKNFNICKLQQELLKLVKPTFSNYTPQVHNQNFLLGGGADPEAIHNLCLIFKIIL
jgi:hypothetical protein